MEGRHLGATLVLLHLLRYRVRQRGVLLKVLLDEVEHRHHVHVLLPVLRHNWVGYVFVLGVDERVRHLCQHLHSGRGLRKGGLDLYFKEQRGLRD